MSIINKEIIAGRGFYYMPSAYITLKVTVEGILFPMFKQKKSPMTLFPIWQEICNISNGS